MAVNQFLAALKNIEPFPHQSFIDRLYNKAIKCSNVAIFKEHLASQPPYGEDPDSQLIDGVDVSQHLQLLAEHAAVKGLARYDPDADKHGLRGCANATAAGIAGDALFVQTSTLLYSEHINWQLTKNGSADLRVLWRNVDFVNGLEQELRSDHFINGALRQDVIAGDHTYTTALLFTYDYVHRGPGFTPHLDESLASAPSGKLLASWTPSLFAGLTPTQQASSLKFLTKATSVVHALTNPAGNIQPDSTLANRAQVLAKMQIVPPNVAQLQEHDSDVWQAMCQVNKVLWANTDSKWTNAVVSMASQSTSTVAETGNDAQKFGEGFVIGITMGLEDHKTWQRTTITGQEVANWINQGRRSTFSALFTQDAPNVVETTDYTTDAPVAASCFIAGTQVAIEDSSIAVEEITEGTRILTSVAPLTYGVASDEDVVVPLTVPFLCGINGDKPFFTPGHVFHTTAGLKAVDPDSAKHDNAWLEVGRLAPGHILYRLAKDAKSYEQVEVKSINVEMSQVSKVYGVHLREGYRSYHANGYLVAVNYPEITTKSIAKTLATFPKDQRTAMLLHIKELQPLFQRFGAATMSDVLTSELRGVKRRGVSQHPSLKRRRVTSQLRQARRTYQLHESENKNASGYQLPILSIHEGIVSLDGEAQSRAVIDSNDRTIRWTRSVPKYGYEHGFVDMLNHGLAGNGAILLSENSDQEQLSGSAEQKLIKFTAAKPNVKVNRTPSRAPDLQHQNMNTVLKSVTRKKVALGPITSTPSSSPLPLDVPGLKLAATTPVGVSGVNADFTDGEDIWNITLDKAVWPVGQARTKPVDPESLGEVIFATYHSGGTAGIPIPIMTMPILDTLCDEINKKQVGPGGEIDTLYSSIVQITSEATQMGTIFLDSAALLYQLADKPDGSDELKSVINVTFKKSLGIDLVLPILFRTLAVELAPNFASAKGTATEYDSDNRGGDGQRHFLQDSDSMAFTAASLSARRTVSRALAIAHPSPMSISSPKSDSPALVTNQLSTATELSVGDLEALPSYNSVNVHDTSQTLLQNMMLYHMNDDTRTTFLQTAKPDSLPLDLGKNLESGLKTWIHDEYAPAYISFMVSQVKTDNVTWRNNFTDAEKAKIWYWWSGQGKNCLATSKEYNQLNSLTSVYAVRQLYSTVLDKYIADGPTKWANAMLTDITQSTHAFVNYLRAPFGGGESILNKHSNILNALDPAGNFADKFFNQVVSYAIAQNIANPLFPLDKDEAEKQKEWLNDSMKQLIIMVLNTDPKLPSTVRASLMKYLNDFAKQEGINQNQAAEKQALEMISKTAELTTTIALYMEYIAEGVKVLSRANCFKAAAGVVNKALSSSSALGKLAVMKGVYLVCVAVGYGIVAFKAFSNWDNLSDAQRAIAIISTLAMFTDIIAKSISLYEAVKEYRASKNPLSNGEASKAQVLDDNAVKFLQSPEGAVKINEINEKVVGTDLKGSQSLMTTSEKQPLLPAGDSSKVHGYGTFEPGKPLVGEVGKDPPADLPPSARKGWRDFATGENLLKLANVCIGIAFTVAMAFDLKDNWDSYTDVGKALNVLQIVVQGLTVMVDAAVLLGDALVTAGIWAADCTMMVALPILGAVLAVIGMVVMIVLSSLNIIKPQEPPPSPVEVFITDVARPWVTKSDSPPPLSLTYTVGTPVKAESTNAVPITATNNTDHDVTLSRTTLTLEVGDDSAALFSSPTTSWVLADNYNPKDSPLTKSGTVGVGPATLASATLMEQDRSTSLASYDLAVMGAAKAGISGPLTLSKGQTISLGWLGVLNKAGTTTLQVIETLNSGDKCRFLADIVRS